MALFIKLAAEAGSDLPQILLWRQLVPVPILLGWLWLTGGLARLKTRRPGAHASRGLVGMVGMVFNFLGVMLLPLAEATALGFTAPLFAVVIGSLIMREKIGPWRWSAVVLGFAGVLVIAQPGGAPISPLGAAASLGSALMVAIVTYQIRDLGRSEESISIVFYFSLFGALFAACLLPFGSLAWPGGTQFALLLMVGLFGTLGQLFITASLRRGAIASVIVMDYSALVWSALFGWLVWSVFPPPTTWLGAPLIIAAGSVIAWREHRLSRQTTPSAA